MRSCQSELFRLYQQSNSPRTFFEEVPTIGSNSTQAPDILAALQAEPPFDFSAYFVPPAADIDMQAPSREIIQSSAQMTSRGFNFSDSGYGTQTINLDEWQAFDSIRTVDWNAQTSACTDFLETADAADPTGGEWAR